MQKKEIKRTPRVEVLVGTWKQYGRGIIEGVWRYAQKHGPWLIEVEPTEADESTAIPSGMRVDGIIALIHKHEFAEKLREYDVPVVNVSGTQLEGVSFPRVTSDAPAVVRMAVEHLRDKGLKTIAYCGEPQRHFIDYWRDAYLRVMEDIEAEALIYTPSPEMPNQAKRSDRQKEMQHWLEGLSKPVGVIGWDTETCRCLAMACAVAEIYVPDEVAILGLESSDLLSRVVHPPLSGVEIPVEQIGYEAARMLDQLLRGECSKGKELRLPPLGIRARQSTDLIAVDDPNLKQALRFIREHAHEGIDVRSVLRAVPMARRTLERRFSELLSRTPSEEIRRTKVEKLREMLISTDMPIPDVSEACGFKYVEHMIPVFKKYHGCTPSQYRRKSRAGG